MKHSEGKWNACCKDRLPHFIFCEDKTICSMRHNDPVAPSYERLEGTVTIEECRANAKLIAAAPDLLEALLEVVRISDRKHDSWDKAKRAIKKATE